MCSTWSRGHTGQVLDFSDLAARNDTVEDAKEFLAGQCANLQHIASEVDGKFVSALVRAVKPVAQHPVAAESAAAPRSSAGSGCCATQCCGSR
jgi:hypothetical protein